MSTRPDVPDTWGDPSPPQVSNKPTIPLSQRQSMVQFGQPSFPKANFTQTTFSKIRSSLGALCEPLTISPADWRPKEQVDSSASMNKNNTPGNVLSHDDLALVVAPLNTTAATNSNGPASHSDLKIANALQATSGGQQSKFMSNPPQETRRDCAVISKDPANVESQSENDCLRSFAEQQSKFMSNPPQETRRDCAVIFKDPANAESQLENDCLRSSAYIPAHSNGDEREVANAVVLWAPQNSKDAPHEQNALASARNGKQKAVQATIDDPQEESSAAGASRSNKRKANDSERGQNAQKSIKRRRATLCHDCGKWHHGECAWPQCPKRCGLKHTAQFSCQVARQQLHQRLAQAGVQHADESTNLELDRTSTDPRQLDLSNRPQVGSAEVATLQRRIAVANLVFAGKSTETIEAFTETRRARTLGQHGSSSTAPQVTLPELAAVERECAMTQLALVDCSIEEINALAETRHASALELHGSPSTTQRQPGFPNPTPATSEGPARMLGLFQSTRFALEDQSLEDIEAVVLALQQGGGPSTAVAGPSRERGGHGRGHGRGRRRGHWRGGRQN